MNTAHAQREFEAYRKDDAEARAILDSAAAESRATTAEEDERFDRLAASAESHKKRADKLVAMDAESRSADEAVRGLLGGAGDRSDSGSARDGQLIANIRAIQADWRKNGETNLELLTHQVVDLEKRTITDFGNNASLYTADFSTKVAVYQRTTSPWINLAEVINADNGRPINLPNLSADPTMYTPGEGTAITAADPTLGSAALTTTAFKALGYVSMEAEEDELVGLLNIIAKSQGRSIGLGFGSTLTSTIVTAATNGGTAAGKGGGGGTAGTATNAFIGYEDLLDLKYGRAVPYRMVGAWVMANSAIKIVRKFKDGQGDYLWRPAIALGQPDMFDGNPVYEDPYLAAVASATKSVLFGDPSAVVIKQMPLRIATSQDYQFNLDTVAIKTVYRAGGALPDAAALAYLVSANT